MSVSTRGETAVRIGLGAVAGLVSGCAALAVAELAAVAVRPEASPLTAVGGAVVDRTPTPVKDWAIREFGTDDKLVLRLGLLAALGLFAAVLGALAVRRRGDASLGVLAFGLLGAVAATGRPDSTSPLDAVPSLAGAAAGSVVLYVLTGRLTAAPAFPVPHGHVLSRGPLSSPTPSSAAASPTAPDEGHAPAAPAVSAGGTGPSASDEQSGRGRDGEPSGGGEPQAGGEPGGAAGPLPDVVPPAGGRGGVGEQDTGLAPDAPRAEGEDRPADGQAPGEPPGDPAPGTRAAGSGPRSRATTAPSRRLFVLATAGTAIAATGIGALGRRLNASTAAEAEASRAAIRLPAPTSPAPALPRRVDLKLPGLTPYTTPNKRFYRVDTALTVPRLDAGSWRLRLHGKGVTAPLTLDFQDLLARGPIERDITLTCVSNEVGGPYVSSARWLGVPLKDLLAEAGVQPPSRGGPADQLVARSVDGMTLGSPVETVMDGRDAMLAVGMNGEPLPFDHGFPVRMLVPGLYGYVSACKWIQELELTTFDAYDVYWVKRDWAREAPIKTQSRIDTPRPFARPKAGRVTVAGVAWAQHKGIARVEVRVDEGPWQRAELAAEGPRDTWRQWSWQWPATAGSHTLQVRATDRTGHTQTAERTGTVPDGAAGRHSVVVDVT
ncbi:molybdopterin oxidoreductase [Streptomyces triticagri]|uniref:Molybdopterin oxidoreductase n=1 Tax=Streptomyces triticagri TaxID=2293568 RepID=A0A372M4H2_9ACTN|nr:molybdopterin-dependent oxidoreductase [Streptomyces triticagri]RFU85520.1 molybdopterin oxidoreductase [Streptomyces triticagri]